MSNPSVLTTADVDALADRMLRDDLVILPVRHHSPACALHVRNAIRDLRPSVVLVEGPGSMTPLVPLLAHPEARMPLAVYAYVVRDPVAGGPAERIAAYFPFCDYSPELVAVREASAQGVEVRFVDLELSAQQSLQDEAHATTPAPGGRSFLDERHYGHSARLQALAEQEGCRDHEDLWEHLFEADAGTTSLREHLTRLTAYCLLARRDHTAEELAADATTSREAEMAWHVREALARRQPGHGPVLVVVGGFHAVALPDLVDGSAERPAVPAPVGRGDLALIRYTFDRLERLNGYAAGMTSPAWHQQLWSLLSEGEPDARQTAALTTLLDITAELRRRHHLPVPTPAVMAAYEQALRLTALRQRVAPLRSDLLDAVRSCFVKGDADVEGAAVELACRQVLTGAAVGTVPPGAGTPLLVGDTTGRLSRARLVLDGIERRTTALDLYRRGDHRRTSRLLHGLASLGIPFAHRTAGPDFARGQGVGRLREQWDYLWTPATEAALVEASVLGSSLPEAVAARFDERLRAARDEGVRVQAVAATELLVQACVLGLQDEAEEVLDVAREAIAADPAFDGVVHATGQLALLSESREPLEASRLAGLEPLIRTAYERAVYLGRELTGAQCEPQAAAGALVGLRELLVSSAGEGLDDTVYWEMVLRLVDRHDHALVRGAAAGLAYSSGRLDTAGLANAVVGHLAGTATTQESVGFLRGLLRTAREVAWQEVELVSRIDERLRDWDADTFLATLPELRLAFAGMTPHETDRIATLVARLHGRADLGPLLTRGADDDQVLRHLSVSHTAARLLTDEGLGEWVADG